MFFFFNAGQCAVISTSEICRSSLPIDSILPRPQASSSTEVAIMVCNPIVKSTSLSLESLPRGVLRNILSFAGLSRPYSSIDAITLTSWSMRLAFLPLLSRLGRSRGRVGGVLLSIPNIMPLPSIVPELINETIRPSRVAIVGDTGGSDQAPFMAEMFRRGILQCRQSVLPFPFSLTGAPHFSVRSGGMLRYYPSIFVSDHGGGIRHEMDICQFDMDQYQTRFALRNRSQSILSLRPDIALLFVDARQRTGRNYLALNRSSIRQLFGDDVPFVVVIANCEALDEAGNSSHRAIMRWVRNCNLSCFGVDPSHTADGLDRLFREIDRVVTTRRSRGT